MLNDGVGVALFVCFSGLVSAQENGGFISIMMTELFGAILVGLIVTAISFPIFRKTQDETRKIFTSLFAVTTAYLLCEHFGFSGAIASVVCGILYSALRNYADLKGSPMSPQTIRYFLEVIWVNSDRALNVPCAIWAIGMSQIPPPVDHRFCQPTGYIRWQGPKVLGILV